MSSHDTIEVECNSGRVRGRRSGEGGVFKGIPYAVPPVGPLRFRAPEPLTPWSGVRDAFEFGAQSLQTSADLDLMGATAVVGLLFEPPEHFLNSEDCLYLNVWTPAVGGHGLPVMVWCHSGGFFAGSGASKHSDGSHLSERSNVVVVTINHRLGLMGFLHLADLGDRDFTESGNAGLLDLVAALTWIRENIAAFGGDPHNVTLFGQSGGGAKVESLLAMPRARGLFHRAIIQSGAWRRFREPEDATAVAADVLHRLGVNRHRLSALQDLPPERILAAQHETMKALIARPQAADGSLADRHLGPVRDGTLLPYHPFSAEALQISSTVPLLIGTTRDEGTFFMSGDDQLATLDATGLLARVQFLMGGNAAATIDAYQTLTPTALPSDLMIEIITDQFVRMPAILHAELKSALRAAPVFMYLFAYETDVLDQRLRATHGVEIPFAFDNVDSDPLAGSDTRRHEVAHLVSAAWAAFATSGVPSHSGLPAWPAYESRDRTTMILGLSSHTQNDPEQGRREAWRRL